VKGLGNLGNMMKQAKRLQEELERAQAEIEQLKIDATAGGGMVNIAIEREVIDPDDPEMLTALVIAAVQEAQRNAREESERRLGPLAQGFGIPG